MVKTGIKFLADSMLGSLAKWLRVLGYDTCYSHGGGDMAALLGQGRLLLTRDNRKLNLYPYSLMIYSDFVQKQIITVMEQCNLSFNQQKCFSLCLQCNSPLKTPDHYRQFEGVPEFVLQEKRAEIKFCPSCNRYFWPGTHRENMLRQLVRWRIFK